jgi:hypothetical protein
VKVRRFDFGKITGCYCITVRDTTDKIQVDNKELIVAIPAGDFGLLHCQVSVPMSKKPDVLERCEELLIEVRNESIATEVWTSRSSDSTGRYRLCPSYTLYTVTSHP